MLYQGIIGGGSSPVEPMEPVLLWTNPSPTSAFSPQKIDLDLTNYVGVIVEYRYSNEYDFMCTRTFVKKDDVLTYTVSGGNVAEYGSGCGYKFSDSDSWASRGRTITSIDNTGITFGRGGYANSVEPNNIIPTKIYGVKEYVVEPVVGDLLWTNASPTTAFTPQKISVDLSNANGAVIEVMVSTTTQIVCSKQLVYKGDKNVGVGYSAGGVAQTRNITSVENDGITFETGYNANTASDTILIPYKIYSIN